MTEPWRNWHPDERWQIAAEYQAGASTKELARRYRRDPVAIRGWLRALGILRTAGASKALHSGSGVRKAVTPAIHTLAAWLVRAQEMAGRLTADQIANIMSEIHCMNGGNVSIGSGHYERREAAAS